MKIVPEEEIPRQPRIRVFISGPILPKDRLIEMLRAQNLMYYPSSDWDIIRMDTPSDAGRNVILAVNHETLVRLEKNGFRISVGISSAFARPVIEVEDRVKSSTVSNR